MPQTVGQNRFAPESVRIILDASIHPDEEAALDEKAGFVHVHCHDEKNG